MPRASAKSTLSPGTHTGKTHAWAKLYPFAKDVLHYDKMEPQPHTEMCGYLDDIVQSVLYPTASLIQTKGMLLVPRGCFKTTVGTVALSLKVLEANPNARILIDTHTWDYSCQILSEIKQHLEYNEAFIKLFGDWKENSTKWAEDAITIGRRTQALKEPSIDTSGVDKSKNGGHYDLIIADDLHEEKNSATEAGRVKVWRHIQSLYPILNPGGVLLLNGTRWHHSDAYGRIIQKNREAFKAQKPEPFRVLHRSCFNKDGTLYFPTQLTHEFLAQMRLECDDKMFAVWYLNQPIEDSSKYFPEKYIQFFDGSYVIDRGQPTLEIY
jgi:hypothetical protein